MRINKGAKIQFDKNLNCYVYNGEKNDSEFWKIFEDKFIEDTGMYYQHKSI